MIPITRFREWCIELVARVNADTQVIDGLAMAVKEEHMVKKLKDKQGVLLGVNYPDALCNGAEDNASDDQTIYFFVVEKVNPGSQTDDDEIAHYGTLQFIMEKLRDAVRESSHLDCFGVVLNEDFRIEWEYQIFGGFNGLSMGFKITDNIYG